jgi:hypothetical protein
LHRYYEEKGNSKIAVYGLDALVEGSNYGIENVVDAILQHSCNGWEDWELRDVQHDAGCMWDYQIERPVKDLDSGEIPNGT